MPNIDFLFDFASPNAYLAHYGLLPVLERTGAEANYVPVLLGGIFKATNNRPPMMAFSEIKGKFDYEMLEFRRFLKTHGLRKFKMNPHFPVNSIRLQRGMIVAQRDGFWNAYLAAGLKAMWEDGLDMSKSDVFAKAMDEAGLDGAAILEASQDDSVKQVLMENTAKAVERGVFGIPTFFVGDEMFWGKERLGQIEAEVMKQGG